MKNLFKRLPTFSADYSGVWQCHTAYALPDNTTWSGRMHWRSGEKAVFLELEKNFPNRQKRKSCEYYWGYVFVRLDRGQADKLKKQPAKTIR